MLYDGDCGFCASAVQFMLKRDPAGPLRFAPLQGQAAAHLRERHPWLHGLDSMAWVEPLPDGAERVLVRSAAALQAAAYLGGVWRIAAVIGQGFPVVIADAAYNLVARHRHQLAPSAGCYLPSPAERTRFLA
jgi:predicted DCC family thiol-disulfide oxidoreductase YuxK